MYSSIAQANEAIIERIKAARRIGLPSALRKRRWLNYLLDVNYCTPGRQSRQEMTGPMRGACIGASLFEGWATSEEEAVRMLEQGEVEFIPCHHVGAVGPMGITSANMPVLVVRDVVHGNQSCCNLNEGIGKVMRFGAYGEDVQTRLRWMRDTLAPVLQALSRMENGVDLTAMMAQAITMGDEFHQRNIAASSLLRTLSPVIAGLERPKAEIVAVLQFLSVTDRSSSTGDGLQQSGDGCGGGN